MTATDTPPAVSAAGPPAAADDGHPVLFFDGQCGLCNAAVDWLMARDPRGVLRFAPLQGETAEKTLPDSDRECLDSLVFLDEAGRSRRSRAVVRALGKLGGRWTVAAWALWLVPGPLRDLGYRLVAKVRYAIWGKKETCRMPTPEERARFLP
ncbi:thiol-disulfide oxidoreductase DCC family protein [Alienimonas sp. DA493]|uniref:thiol-disulfide oxidoreductase DCC family protein n=1 Tax=Alienimonas sp. DA493 TaxID=3373605 RepID=UPI0037548CC7